LKLEDELLRPSLRAIATCAGSVLLALGVGAALLAWSGLYNIAATDPHWAVTYWLLDFGKRQSIETQSIFDARRNASDANLVALGAGHFDGGCAPCHGAPGRPMSPINRAMLPFPADLAKVSPTYTDPQLRWIVRNGLKFTAMPAFPAPERGDEIDAVVAFLRALPEMSEADYQRMAIGSGEAQTPSGRELATQGAEAASLTKCVRCHDRESHRGGHLVPKLAGQSQNYLEMSLRAYANASRPSGVMQPIAAALDEREIVETAKYYAQLPAAPLGSGPVATERIERGRVIATVGVLSAGAPPCLACHGGKSVAAFPALSSQHARYIVGQLRLFRQGIRSKTAYAAIMSVIAPRLTEEQSEDVAAYFASLAPSAPPLPIVEAPPRELAPVAPRSKPRKRSSPP
jgi:cytochrome c553